MGVGSTERFEKEGYADAKCYVVVVSALNDACSRLENNVLRFWVKRWRRSDHQMRSNYTHTRINSHFQGALMCAFHSHLEHLEAGTHRWV